MFASASPRDVGFAALPPRCEARLCLAVRWREKGAAPLVRASPKTLGQRPNRGLSPNYFSDFTARHSLASHRGGEAANPTSLGRGREYQAAKPQIRHRWEADANIRRRSRKSDIAGKRTRISGGEATTYTRAEPLLTSCEAATGTSCEAATHLVRSRYSTTCEAATPPRAKPLPAPRAKPLPTSLWLTNGGGNVSRTQAGRSPPVDADRSPARRR